MGTELQKASPTEVSRPEGSVLDIIAAAARDSSVDPSRLTALLEFKERIDRSQAEKEFNIDFAAAMAQMPKVVKRGKIDMGAKGQMAFATYEDIDAAIRPIEQQYGFVRSFSTEPCPSGITVTLVLRHRSGHAIQSTRFMPPDTGAGRNNMQATGSAESYAKRYLTNGVWNIVTIGQDNNANTAEPLSQEQADQMRDLLTELGIDPKDETFLKWAETPSFSKIQRPQFDRIMRGLEAKRRNRK